MDVVSVCPIRTASLLWQPRQGSYCLTVVCKATFALVPGEARLADEQEYPNEDDNHWNDDPQRSLYSPSDLAPFKQRGDVTLVGHAFAPRGEPVRSLVVRMIVGEVDKSIEVHGERSWSPDGLLREGPRFAKMPLRYERAAGGPDTRNPVGIRADGRPDVYGNVAIANLQPTGLLVTEPSDQLEPIGFGPIAPAWSTRLERLGRHAPVWSHGRWHGQPLPEDVEPGYWNAAPQDQQVAAIRDNERIILENLHPEHARLVTTLPGIRPRGFAELGGAVQEVALACDTLWIDTDRSICTLTWRGQLGVDGPGQAGRVVIGMESGTARLSWADLQRGDGSPAPRQEAPAEESSSRSALADLAAPRPVAAPAQVRPPTPDAPRSVTDASDLAARRRTHATLSTMVQPPSQASLNNALPFMPSLDGAPSRPSSPAAAEAPSSPLSDGMPAWLQRPRGPGGSPSVGPSGPPSRAPQAAAPPPQPPPLTPPPMAPPPMAPPPMAPPPLTPPPMAPPPMAPPPMAPPPMAAPAPPPLGAMAVDSPWAGGGSRGSEASGVGMPPMIAAIPPATPSSPSISGSAIAASNAAAASAVWAAPPPPAPIEAAPAAVRPIARGPRDVVDLIWFDPTIPPKVREHERWKDIIAELRPKPRESGFDFDEPEEPEIDQAVEDRRDVFGVLTRAETADAEGVNEAMSDAVGDDGNFTPPLVLLAGELEFPFDELETLKATVTAVTPLIAGDKKLKETVDTVNELLKTPWLQSSTGVAEGLTARVKEAFAQGNRMLPASYLDSHTDRILLEQRHYQKRTVFGEVWIRSLLTMPGSPAPIPAYLPEALSKKLPMFQSLRVRMIAEAHAQQDQYEAHPTALRVVTLGRFIVTTRR